MTIANIEIVATVIGSAITLVSFIFGLWERKAKLNVQKMLQEESLHLFSSVALVLGNCQNAITSIKDKRIPDALENTSKAEGGSQMLLQQTAKIVCNYHNPTDEDIDNWIERGKIKENFKSVFLAYSDKNKGWLHSTFRKLKEKIM
jgi:hypothetical protein